MRIQFQDNWFHIKFLIVGALFAAFWVKVKIAPESRLRGREGNSFDLNTAMYSDVTGITLALAIVIALIIDTHIRTEVLVVNQLGTWIAHYVDPTLLSVTRFELSESAFRPWETFLRGEGAMHTDWVYSYTFWVHLHAATWLLYILYFAWRSHWKMSHSGSSPPQWPVFFDALIHLSLCAFAWASHAVPGTFALKPWIFRFQPSLSGLLAPIIFAVCALAIWLFFCFGTDSMATLLKVESPAPPGDAEQANTFGNAHEETLTLPDQ